MHIGDTFFTSLAGRGACEPTEEKCLALLDSLGIEGNKVKMRLEDGKIVIEKP